MVWGISYDNAQPMSLPTKKVNRRARAIYRKNQDADVRRLGRFVYGNRVWVVVVYRRRAKGDVIRFNYWCYYCCGDPGDNVRKVVGPSRRRLCATHRAALPYPR